MGYQLNDHGYIALLESIRAAYGYDFTQYAAPSVKRRITAFMDVRAIPTLAALEKIILDDERIFEEFVQHLSITVTEMFRDPFFYKYLREKVVPQLATYPVVKVWIAGCATGQEVYSTAILLKEEGLLDRAIIYATDINQQSLHIARQGIYQVDNMKTYTNNYLHAGGRHEFSEYYHAQHNAVVFQQSLRQNVVFAAHNLVTDQSFNEFQMIMCRNVLMYFNQALQSKVIDLFYESLCPFGFLGLGDKESLLFTGKQQHFDVRDRREKIYQKRG